MIRVNFHKTHTSINLNNKPNICISYAQFKSFRLCFNFPLFFHSCSCTSIILWRLDLWTLLHWNFLFMFILLTSFVYASNEVCTEHRMLFKRSLKIWQKKLTVDSDSSEIWHSLFDINEEIVCIFKFHRQRKKRNTSIGWLYKNV